MISAQRIVKSYGAEANDRGAILRGLSLKVEAGQFVAILGPSGSGKSTLLHLLGGLDVRYQGELDVCGVRISGLSDRELARFRNRNVGFVFQSFHLIPTLGIAENVLLPAFFDSDPAGLRNRKRAEEMLSQVGLAGKADRYPGQLSGGERQRVAIARALFQAPKLLLCDEPTGNLDVQTGQEIIGLLERLNRGGLTIVTVTHEERVSAVAGRVLRLQEGTLVDIPRLEGIVDSR